MSPRFAHLLSRRLVRIGGPEASDFLQGLISNDVTRIAPDRAIFAALLSAQGKVQFDLIVLGDGNGGYRIDAEASHTDVLIRKLKLYRLRAKVTIEVTDLATIAVFGRFDSALCPATDTALLMAADPRPMDGTLRLYGPREEAGGWLARSGLAETSEEEFMRLRLALGVPEGVAEFGNEKLFLLEANGEELHGVDFKKGCYVGQELTARMKHKTELKKRLLPFRVSSLPGPDTPLMANEREIGHAVGGRLDTAFALVRLDRFAEADRSRLKFGDAPAEFIQPAYLPTL